MGGMSVMMCLGGTGSAKPILAKTRRFWMSAGVGHEGKKQLGMLVLAEIFLVSRGIPLQCWSLDHMVSFWSLYNYSPF
jgi:hypothetical protein